MAVTDSRGFPLYVENTEGPLPDNPMISRLLRLSLIVLLVSILLVASGFGQGSKRKSEYDSVREGDRDQPSKRAEWMRRGRESPKGQSAAALRLGAHRMKLEMRAGREAAAARSTAGSAAVSAGWVGLGPAPLVSDNNFFGMVSGRATSVAIDPSDATGNTVYLGGA